jgi:chaperonin GroES
MSRPLCFCTRGTTCATRGANSEEGFVTTNNQTRIDTMADLTIRPLADRVIVEPAAAETKTASGIIIPDTAQEKPQRGIVRAVGNGKKDEPMTVKVGDTVLYAKYAGSEIKFEGTDYLIMRESDILAII